MMNTLSIFFSEFWMPFVIFAPMWALLTFGRRVSLDGNSVFVGPKSFAELSAFSKDEQKRMLRQADREAFPGWRLIFPVSMYAANMSAALAIVRTIPKVTSLPDSLWVSLSFAVLFVLLGGWIGGRFEVWCIRPFLKIQIERIRHAA